MAEEKEVVRYQFDISDVEAKTARVKALTEEITAKRAAGQDVSELEVKLGREVDALGKLGQKEKEAAGETENLLRQKDKLANVVSVLGGRFGGLVGQLGGVVEMMMRGGKAALGLGAGLAVVTTLITAYQRFTAAVKRAVEEQERLNQAITKQKYAQMGLQGQMEVELEKYGLRTPEGAQAAWTMHARLMKQYGFDQQRAAGIAPMAVAAGLSLEDAARLALYGGQGMPVTSPQQARELLERVRAEAPETYALVGQELSDARTFVEQKNQALGEKLLGQAPVPHPREALFEYLKQTGGLPEGVESPADLQRAIERGEVAKEKIRKAEEVDIAVRPVAAAILPPLGEFARPAWGWLKDRWAREIPESGRLEDQLEREEARQAGGLPPPPPGSPTTQPAGVSADLERQTVIQQEVINIGTMFNAGDKRRDPHRNNGTMSPSQVDWKQPN